MGKRSIESRYPKTFIEISNEMNGAYKYIDDCNPRKKT